MKTTIKLYALILAMSPFLCNAQSVAAVERAVEKQDVKTSNAVIQAKKNAIDGKFSKSYTTANAEFIKSNSAAKVNPEIAEKKNGETDKWQKANVPALKSKAENAKTSKMPKNIGKFADIKLNKEQKAELTKQTFKGVDKRMVVNKQLSKEDFRKTLKKRTAKQSVKKSSPNFDPPENYTLPFEPDMTNAETVWNIIDANEDGVVDAWGVTFGGWSQATSEFGSGMMYLYNDDGITAADDYLVTNAPVVIADGDYVLTVSFENSGFTENVSILYGTTADVYGMNVLDNLEISSSGIFQKKYNLSGVISAGNYYFAVHCTSPADRYYIILSQFKIAEKPSISEYYELPFSGNFDGSEYDIMWSITDEDGDGSTWQPCSPSYAYPFEAGMVAAGNLHWDDEAPSDDWLITNAPVRVPAGDKTLEFAICASYNMYDETVEVLYGTTANTADMISLGTYTTSSVVWDKIKVLLNMAAGDYYFAVRNISSYGDAGVYLANLSITEGYTAPPTSYTLPYGEGFYWSFVHDWTVIDANNDDNSWQQRFIEGNGEAYYQYSYSNAAGDWLLLNKPVAIPAGDNNVGVIYSTVNYPESFEVYYGATQDVNSMTLLGGKYNVTLDGETYKTLPLNLNVPAGDYYFAIKAVSEANQNYILIDSFYIATGPAPINPDLTITKVIKPEMGCSLTESEKLGVVISNQGTGVSSPTVYIRYEVFSFDVGSVTGTDTVQVNILPDEETIYYLNAEFDFSVPDYYYLGVEVTDPDDLNIDNNVYYGSLNNIGVAELPYSNYLYDESNALEFEWTGDDWVYFNVPEYGYKDITAMEETPLLTHCFNVPAGTTHLSMDLGYMAGFSFFGFEDVDTFMIKVGKQGTDIATWSVVADLEGEQTYGDYTSKHFMFDVADGGGTYQIAIVPVYLSGLAVESISIYATPQHDLTITDIIRPVVVCEVDSTESFGFVLKNLGYDTAMTYQVDYGVYNSELGELNVYTADFNTPIAPGETKTVYTVIAEKLVPSSNTDYYNYGVYGNVELTDDENTGNDITDFLYFGIYTPIATPWVSNLYSSGDDFIGGPDVNDWFYSYYDGAMIAESYELPDPLKTRCIEISEAGHYMIMLGYFAGYEEYGLTADFTVKIGLSGTDIASWQTVATYSDIMSSAYFTVDRLFVNLAATGKYQIAVVPTGFSGEEFFMAVDGMSVVQAKAFDVSLNSAIKPSIDCEPGVEEFTVNLINMGYDTLKTLPLYVYGYNYKLTDYLPVTETYDTVILKNLNILPGESAGVKVPVDLSMMESVAYLILNLNDTIAYYSPTLVYFTVDDEVINNDLRNYNETYAYLGIFEPETMPFTPDLPNYGQNAEKYFANVMNIYDAEYYGISSDKWILDHYNAFVYVAGLTLPEALKTHCIQIDNPGNYLLEFKYWAGLSYYDITASVDVLIGKTGTDISSWTKLLEIRDEMAEDYNTVYSPLAISEAGLYQIAIVPKSFEGQFYFDFAKLNLTVPAEHNIVLKSVNNPLSAYTPAKQLAGNTAISATVLNLGKSTENVTVSVLKDNVSIADTVISGIEFGEETTVAVSANPAMQAGDNATFSVEASIEAEDLDTTDNINSFAVTATDSVFAKENLLGFDYGLGAEAAISFGNIYTLSVQDTLTSVSILFAEDAEAQEFGYSVYKILANGELAAAPVISGTAESEVGLITMYFSNSEILEPGSYYAGIDQLGAIPAGVAFDTGNSEDVFYVKVGNLLVPVPGWGSLAIRANVGKATLPSTAIEVNNLGKQSKLNVYTQNRELYIAANEGMKNVSLVNVQGVTVMKSGNINSDNYKFNVQNLASGIYFVRVQMGGELKNVKVIIY